MSMDFTSSDTPSGETENDSPMFAATPIWERGKKKRGFGRSSAPASQPTAAATPLAAEPVVTREPMLGSTMGSDPVMGSPTTVDPVMGSTTRVDPMVAPAVESEPMTAAPYTRTTTVRKKDGVPAVAIAAGVIALGGLAAAGWYASQPRDTGVAQLTPGAPGENALASTAAPAATTTTASTTMAANTPPPAAPVPTVRRSTTTTTRMAATTPRVRPAAVAPSAGDVGVNASATLPSAPQSYSGAATPNPSASAPLTPAPMPSTPAVEPDPAPSASSPTTTTPATPAPEASTAPSTTTPQ